MWLDLDFTMQTWIRLYEKIEHTFIGFGVFLTPKYEKMLFASAFYFLPEKAKITPAKNEKVDAYLLEVRSMIIIAIRRMR